MKVFFRRIHLYLGLTSGLFLVLVCLTGSLLVFEEELTHAFHARLFTVAPATTPRLSLAQLAEAVRVYKPKAKISSFKVYADPTRSVDVGLAGGGRPGGPGGGREGAGGREPRGEGRDEPRQEAGRENARDMPAEGRDEQRGGRAPQQGQAGGRAEARGPLAGGRPGEGQGGPGGGPGGARGGGRNNGPHVFLNPYTGAVLGELNPQQSFFHFVEQIHRGLVAGQVGKLVMGINSLIFLFILGTGIVLWWPAARRALPQRLSIKWGSSWKRLNHDFHIVLGFYVSVFLFITALTGVGMSFNWVGRTINTLTHSPTQRPEPPTSAPGGGQFSADAALGTARQQLPGAEAYTVQLPREPTGSLQVSVLRPDALTERATDDLYFDRHSGQLLRQTSYDQQPVGQRIRGLFKPVHTGAIFGWPTKILALVIVLLGATFPVTGTILWLNRTRKARQRAAPPRVAVS